MGVNAIIGTFGLNFETSFAVKADLVKKGDRIVIIASSPLSTKAKTNFMKLHQGGE